MKTFLVDFGSTYVKYSIYDTKTDVFEISGSEEFPQPEIYDEIHYTVSVEKIKALIFKLFLIAAGRCERCFISVQMHGFLLRNGKDEYTDYISWRDRSGDEKNPGLSNIDFYERGTSLKKNLPIVKLFGEVGNVSECEFYTLGSYIAYLLTNKNTTHITDACASGFYMFDGSVCRDERFENMNMPVCLKDIACIGRYLDMEIYTPMGDHQISFLGSGAGNDKYLLNIGTATQLSCLGDDDYPAGNYEKRPYFDDKGLITISGLVGGAELYKGHGIEELISSIENALRILPPKSGLVIGGGGAGLVFEALRKRFSELNCEKAKENIGREGLKMIAEGSRVKSGVMLSEMEFPNYPVIFKNCGLDFMIIDNEHGAFDYSTVSRLLMNSKLVGFHSIVRLGSNSRESITKYADAGADGFLLPMTNNAADIENVVEYAKYKPIGKRGISTTRAHTLYDPPALKDYMQSANDNMKVFAQIETKAGVDHISEIINTTGVDGVFIGPNDLAADLDCIGNIEPVCQCIEKVAGEVKKAGKVWGIITQNRELIAFSKVHNVNMISYGSELNMIKEGCGKIIGICV